MKVRVDLVPINGARFDALRSEQGGQILFRQFAIRCPAGDCEAIGREGPHAAPYHLVWLLIADQPLFFVQARAT